jgi:hypothetical protein
MIFSDFWPFFGKKRQIFMKFYDFWAILSKISIIFKNQNKYYKVEKK